MRSQRHRASVAQWTAKDRPASGGELSRRTGNSCAHFRPSHFRGRRCVAAQSARRQLVPGRRMSRRTDGEQLAPVCGEPTTAGSLAFLIPMSAPQLRQRALPRYQAQRRSARQAATRRDARRPPCGATAMPLSISDLATTPLRACSGASPGIPSVAVETGPHDSLLETFFIDHAPLDSGRASAEDRALAEWVLLGAAAAPTMSSRSPPAWRPWRHARTRALFDAPSSWNFVLVLTK